MKIILCIIINLNSYIQIKNIINNNNSEERNIREKQKKLNKNKIEKTYWIIK